MPLPRIPAKDPVVKDPVAAKTYSDKYIVALGIQRDKNGKQPCMVALQAYDYDAKELSPDPEDLERFRIADVWEESARSTLFANVMGGLIQVVFLMYQERNLREQLSLMEDGPERDAAIIQFHDIQTQLGVSPLEDPPPPYEGDTVVWAKPDGNTPPLP
jgi:hypothetical protein